LSDQGKWRGGGLTQVVLEEIFDNFSADTRRGHVGEENIVMDARDIESIKPREKVV